MNKAALYSSASGLQRRDAAAVLHDYRARLRWGPGETVLDVGCGSGDVTSSLLLPCLPASFERLVGLDVSCAMVQHARHNNQHPRLTFLQEDIATDDLSGTELWRTAGLGFHKVFSFFCLHWVSEQRKAVRNIARLLRPGGEAVLAFFASCPVFTMYEALATKPQWQDYMQDVSRFVSAYQHSEDPVREFSALLREVGLHIVDCSSRQRSYEFDSLASLTDSLKAVNPFLDRIPVNLQADFLMDSLYEVHRLKLASAMEPNNNAEQKKISTRYSLMVAHVRK